MTTITEDYVSFETAKLLKEKEFDTQCRAAYTNYGQLFTTQIQQYITNIVSSKGYQWECVAPTLQMAMKWLREAHKVNIEIHYNRFGEDYEYLIIYKPEVLDDIRSLGVYYSYEEAAEAAIKYCLENLI